jgi:hypothetical protein
MKLTNPTDAELNAAFAEKVAGWKCFDSDDPWGWRDPSGQSWHRSHIPYFTTSADQVLPWLPKELFGDFWQAAGGYAGVRVTIWSNDEIKAAGDDRSFAKAAALALLRAHGVQVEFTK